MFALPIRETKPQTTSLAATALQRRAQPRLKIGSVNDPLENEADRIADQVMRMPEAAVAVSTSAAEEGTVQRLCAECEEEVQRKSADGAASAAPAAESAIRSLAGGSPLPAAERTYFEPRF